MTTDELKEEIACVLEEEVRPLLPVDLGRYLLTFIARVPGRPGADILVTEEGPDSELLQRIADAVEGVAPAAGRA